MSVELHVLFFGDAPTKASLSTAMRELALPLSVGQSRSSLAKQKGFMPARWKGEETGVEFDIRQGREAVEDIVSAVKDIVGLKKVDIHFDRTANLRWSGDEIEMSAARCIAAALAKLTNGVVFDPQSGWLLSVDEAIVWARSTLESLAPKAGETRRPGTRPADIKRYLKPLLQQRRDLVLRGRLLMITPVRHVLRGIFFDRTIDPTGFQIYECVDLLGRSSFPYHRVHHYENVTEPYFQPWLLERVRDILERVSLVSDLATLADYIAAHWDATAYEFDPRWRAHALAGEREKVEAFLGGLAQGWSDHVASAREELALDPGSFCVKQHAMEERAAVELKLGDAWQRTPFPMELPADRRLTETREPAFLATPWPERPPNLIAEFPQAGDVAFARRTVVLDGRLHMLAPLTRSEAEVAWENFEDYVLLARSAAGVPMKLVTRGRLARYQDYETYGLGVGGGRLIGAGFRALPDQPGWLLLDQVNLMKGKSRTSFCIDAGTEEVTIDNGTTEIRRLTADELAVCRFQQPAFGKYEPFLSSLKAFLELQGISEIA